MGTAVVVPRSKAQLLRKLLEEQGLWDKTRKLQQCSSDSVAVPVNTDDVSILAPYLHKEEVEVKVVQINLPPSKSQKLVTPAQLLMNTVKALWQRCGKVGSAEKEGNLLREVPSHWEKHGDLVLLPASAFLSQEWNVLGQDLWLSVGQCVGAKRVARQAPISGDGFRSPQVELLLGDNSVVQHVDNGIRYEYDIAKCMFSVGNITEKLRIAKFDCRGETVVDLYAGIGYFTLPYLVHGGASFVHACEWNPDAAMALKRNLELNSVAERCAVHQGDNRQLTLKGIADRVNLGLIPSSEGGWPVACRVLKSAGGILHIHGNVNSHTGAGEEHPLMKDIGQSGSHGGEDSSCSSACGGRATLSCASVNTMKRMETEIGLQESSLNHITMGAMCDSYRQQHNEGTQEGSYNKVSHVSSMVKHEETNTYETSPSLTNHKNDEEMCHSDSDIEDNNSVSQVSATSELAQNDQVRSQHCSKTAAWNRWAETVCGRLRGLLEHEHGVKWVTTVMHIEPVKSYAPHVHHVVLDVKCVPALL